MTTTHLSNIAPSPFNASRNNRTEQPASTEKPASAAPASPSAAENTFETVAGTATPLPAAAATTVTNSPLSVRLQGAAAVGDRPAETKIKRGVLLTSHGDIDNPATQLRDYVREAVLKNSGIPLPKFMRPLIDVLGWPLQRDALFEQYDATGPTKYNENSLKQAAALDKALKEQGIEAKTYVGYNFTSPNIEETIAQMQADGINEIIMFNQGAQNSLATMGESIDEVKEAIDKRPDWDIRVVSVNSFSEDERFVKLLTDRLLEDAKTAFPDADPKDVLLLVTSHGLPNHLIDKGDKATEQMLNTFAEVRKRIEAEGYQVEHGFLNDDFFPGSSWTEPKATEMAEKVIEGVLAKHREAPKHVLLDGRLSFTVHHRATLFDANVDTREIFETPAGPPWARYEGAEVKLARNFDEDPGLAKLYAELTAEALAGTADDMTVVDP